MPTTDTLTWAADWLSRLEASGGSDAIVHEVAALATETQAESQRRRRYQVALYEASEQLRTLAGQTGSAEVSSMADAIRRLWMQAEFDDTPVQTAF